MNSSGNLSKEQLGTVPQAAGTDPGANTSSGGTTETHSIPLLDPDTAAAITDALPSKAAGAGGKP